VSVDGMVGERLEELATFGGQDVRAYGNVAKAEKIRDIKEHVLGPFARSHVQKQAERAKAEDRERFNNSLAAIFTRRREVEAANVAALDDLVRKMDAENQRIEAGQNQAAMNRERRARLEKIAAAVTQALNTYSDQTSGFRSLITSQSAESVQASEALRRMAAVASPDPALESTVRWLLGKGGSKPPALSVPLKPGSRFYGLLESAYAGT
jgi:thioredoxin-like negative regulator of GroEL